MRNTKERFQILLSIQMTFKQLKVFEISAFLIFKTTNL